MNLASVGRALERQQVVAGSALTGFLYVGVVVCSW